MRSSIATVSMGGLLRDKLQAIAAAGFEGVELFETDVLASERSPEEIAAMAGELGLEIVALQPLRDFEGMPGGLRARAFERARRRLELATRLGTTRLLICSNVHRAAEGGIDRAADDLRELGGLAADAGITVGFEALAWGRHVRDWRDAWEIVRRADHPAIGLVLDAFHILAPGYPGRADPRRAGRPHRLRPGLGRAAHRHGRDAALAPPPLLPGPGRARPAGVHGGARRHRL